MLTNIQTNTAAPSYYEISQAPLLTVPEQEYRFIPTEEIWTNLSLRKTTLFKGDYIRGLIAFLRDDNVRNVDVKFKDPEMQKEGIRFKHKIYKP